MEGIDRETLRKRNIVLIPRNTPLPAKVRDRFATKAENQTSIVLQVLEGEIRRAGGMHGHRADRDPRPAVGPAQNWPVEVTFEYGANGRLRVHGLVPGTHQSVMLCLERTSGLSDESILRWKQPIDAAAGFDRFETILREVLHLGPPEADLPLHDTPPADAGDFSGGARGGPAVSPPAANNSADELDALEDADAAFRHSERRRKI